MEKEARLVCALTSSLRYALYDLLRHNRPKALDTASNADVGGVENETDANDTPSASDVPTTEESQEEDDEDDEDLWRNPNRR